MDDLGNMDKLYVSELAADTVIGIYDWERRVRQRVYFDLELGTDIRAAAADDDFQHALDYKALTNRVVEFVEAAEFHLVETLAERVAQLILDEFDVRWLRLRLNKRGALRKARDVGVLIEREPEGAGTEGARKPARSKARSA